MTESILVTGGAGYIGSHTCKTIAANGMVPVVLDNLSSGYRDFVQWGPFIEADVNDHAAVSAAIKEHDIKAVIDFAGSIEVAESVENPLKYYENNMACKIGFLQTLNDAGVKAIVFSSTAAVYGEPERVPITEDQLKIPKNPYGWSKLFYEQLLADYHAAGGPAWMALRYFNAAGASPDGDIGEAHEPETHLIPRACMAALGKASFAIFGDDYPTPDGTAVRDYIHVLDLASAHVLAVKALLGGATSAAYNLGNGNGTSVKEIVDTFAELGRPIDYANKPRRAGDPAQLIANSDAAQKALGWTPQHADLKSIIGSALKWHESRI